MTLRTATGPSRLTPSRRRWRLLAVVSAVLLVVAAGFAVTRWIGQDERETPPATAGPRTWLSGAWVGGEWGVTRVEGFGEWRGAPLDFVTTYPAYGTWGELAESDWHVSVFDGFEGRLAYGLPLLPKDEAGAPGALAAVAAGEHDDVFNAVADALLAHDRGDSVIRIGLEAQGDWFPWGAGNGANNPDDFKAAFAHVSRLLRGRLPEAEMMFDISCGAVLRDQQDRMDPLTRLYPGDDVVDVIGCDHYDHYTLISPSSERFEKALRPDRAAGLADTLDFARDRGKKFGVPEWGLTAEGAEGGGDNPFFIYSMYDWFSRNASDIYFESYFNEPDGDLGSAIWEPSQNPAAAQEYRSLWGVSGSSPSPTAGD